MAISPVTMAQEPGDRATVQMRDGTKVEGRIEELAGGTLFLRVSQHDQRRINVGDIALIDKRGGASGLPATEIREARGADHVLLLNGGSSVRGRLVTIKGGEGSGDAGPRTYVFRTVDGSERQFGPGEVARIYLGSYPFEAAVSGHTAADVPPTSVPSGGIRVPATAAWVSTGLNVRKGDWVTFNTTGEVQLSENVNDRARSAGSSRVARLSPLPNVNAGALIGRIGMNGQPFGIGDQATVPMPAAGVLYLSVNDDERADNAGEFIVVASRNPR
ncbi:MAG: hypothetical protein Q7R30_24615 [Acidobacteriota bacterium]|nr:hypothetical protein [Acidobacteriota bacterium]